MPNPATSRTERAGDRSTLCLGLAAILLAGCAVTAPGASDESRPGSVPVAVAGGNASGTTGSDTALFAAVLQAVEPFREGFLHVDPRPLRATPPPEGTRSGEALAAVGDKMVRAREEVLHRLGIPATDAVRDSRCAFVAGGYPKPPPPPGQPDPPIPDSVRIERERCMEQGRFVSWIVALPRPGEETDAVPTWIVRLVEYTDYTHAVFDVTAVRRKDGSGERWEVLDVEELYRVYSSRSVIREASRSS